MTGVYNRNVANLHGYWTDSVKPLHAGCVECLAAIDYPLLAPKGWKP